MAKQNNKTPSGYKPSPLGPIPNDWEIKRIDQFAPLQRGFDLPVDNIITGKFPVVFSNGILKYHNEFKAKAPGVVTGRSGTIGKVTFVEENYWPHNTSLWVTNFNGNDPKYVYYFYVHFDLERFSTGSGVPTLNRNDVHSQKIALPLQKEQTAIANLLNKWDRAIQNTIQIIAQKEQRKKWLMQQLLTGKKRLKGFEKEKWKNVKLGEVFDERNETGNFNLPLLSVGAGGIYPQSDSIKKDTSNEDKSKYRKICIGDIGYNTMRMWQGRSALSSLEGIISPAYTVVTPNKNSDAKYYSYLFKTPHLINSFYRNSQGLVDDTLNCKYKDFAIVKTFVPPTKKEQEEIAKVLTLADKEISVLNKKLDQLKEQKKGLMQILLTGKKRLKLKK